MTIAAWTVVFIVFSMLALLAVGKLRADLAALSMAALLGLAQLIGLGVLGKPGDMGAVAKILTGFGQPVVVTLLGLFILTACLEKTGISRLMARLLLRLSRGSEAALIGLFAAAAAFLSLFMNNIAAGALLLPGALEAARLSKTRPSRLLMPVSYGTLLGGVATYFTTANIIVSDLLPLANPPQPHLDVLAFTPTGGLIALAGILFLALSGKRLLPEHEPTLSLLDQRPTGSELEDAYQLAERLWRVRLLPGSPLAGQTLAMLGLGERLGVAAVAALRGGRLIFPISPQLTLLTDDVLWVVGRAERITPLRADGAAVDETHEHITTLGLTFLEIILSPRSAALGRTLKELNFRSASGFTAIALLRSGRSTRTNVADMPLEMGDSLLIVGEPHNLRRLRANPLFIVLESNPSDRPINRNRALLSAGIVAAAVAAAIAGAPVYLAMLCAGLLVVLMGLMNMEEATRAIEWQAIFLIAGMYAVSTAMVNTGLAGLVGDGMVRLVAPLGPLGLAAGAFLLSMALTQLMGGQVTALVTGPVAISAAISLGANPQAVAVAAAIGCSMAFFTPVAHPVNMLMIGPANYTFADFFRVGWRLALVSFVFLLLGMKLFWGM
ncbi:MAG: SLC13 family permease [Anaerolineae bacterium]|nr:SLC13 family permease [Anaerolineae bacterium]